MKLLPSFVAAIVLCLSPKALPAAEPQAKLRLDNPFFAFDNGTGRGTRPLAEQAEMLKDLGYAGIGYTGTKQIPELLKELDARGLKMFSTYVSLKLDGERPAFMDGLPEAIEQLKGRGAALWLYVPGKGPATAEKDAAVVEQIRELAALAEKSGLNVVLYPHFGFYVATVEDALRLAEQADRKNVGVSFNLCHWLREGEKRTPLEPLLKRAMPRLMLVSINGSDKEGTSWDRLIQTLDRGDYDVFAALKTLRRLGYAGPIGLQCYNIKGDERENLQRSSARWREYVAQMRKEYAIELFTKAIERDPKNKSAYANRAAAYNEAGRPNEALADFTKAIELDPDDAYLYELRSIHYRKAMKDKAKADADKEKAEALHEKQRETIRTNIEKARNKGKAKTQK